MIDRSSIQNIYPLSPAQQGMLFHSLLEPESGVYVVNVRFKVYGPLNERAFGAAWSELVRRHDVLRSAFVWENLERPLQVVGVAGESSFACEYVSKDEFEDSRNVVELPLVAGQQAFNLNNAPLMRVTLVPLEAQVHQVIWTYHHLILDGWSLPLLLQEWGAIYDEANSSGSYERLPSELPYRDYIAWLEHQDHDAAKKFWEKQLSGISTPTPLGIDRRPETPPAAGGKSCVSSFSHFLSSEQTASLQELSRRQRLTLSTLVQGAWAVLLSRYGGQNDVVFGVTRSGRPPELTKFEQRVGMYINTLPMRILVDDDQPVREWLRDLQTRNQEQQRFEFAALADIHGVSGFSRQNPLFDSVVVFENYPVRSETVNSQLRVADVHVDEQTNYPLSIFAVVQEQLELRLLFDGSRFTASSIERLAHELELVLDKMASDSTKIGQVVGQLLPPQRLHKDHFGEFCDSECFPAVHELIAAQAQEFPCALAVMFHDESLTYLQLIERVDAFVEELNGRNVQPGATIGILLPRSVEMLVAVLGVLKAGFHYVPLDPTHPESRLQDIIQDARLDWLIRWSGSGVQINSVSPAPFELSTDHKKGSDLAYLIYTSGSTGKPKGVPITHRSLSNLIQSMAKRLDFTPERRLLAVTTLAFDIAALELFMPLCYGGTVVIADEDTSRDGEKLAAAIQEFSVDTMQATPSTWRILGWNGRFDFICDGNPENRDEGTYRRFTILCGGEPIDFNLAEALVDTGADVWNVYGPTETTIWSGALRLTKERLADGVVPIGGPLDNTSFFVLDPNQRIAPMGVAGELWIGGDGLSPGYHHQDYCEGYLGDLGGDETTDEGGIDASKNATDHRFVELELPNPVGQVTRQRVYRTGDLVRTREDGTFEFLGRMDNQIKLRGHRIELGEIEAVLQTHEAVQLAVVVVGDQDTPDAHLLAAIQNRSGAPRLDDQLTVKLRSHLLNRVPAYMVPVKFCEVEQFPMTPNNKIDRGAVLASFLAGGYQTTERSVADPDGSSSSTNSVEATLSSIWQNLLKLDSVNTRDNFFEIGGHSLLLLRARDELRKQLEVELPLVDFFRFPTVQSLAAHIQGDGAAYRTADRVQAIEAGKSRLKRRRTGAQA